MKLLGIALLVIGSSAVASTPGYDLKMDLSVNGQHMSPQMVVKEGEKSTAIQKTDKEQTYVEVVATEGQIQDRKGIMMKFIVGSIDQNGKKKIISQPLVLAKENEPARVIIGKTKDGKEILSLSVVAKRTAL